MVNLNEMIDYKLFSADSHVSEPPDLWLERIDPAYQFRAPRVETRMKDGRMQDFMVYEGFPRTRSRWVSPRRPRTETRTSTPRADRATGRP